MDTTEVENEDEPEELTNRKLASFSKSSTMRGLRLSGVLRTWADVSRVNFLSSPWSVLTQPDARERLKSFLVLPEPLKSLQCLTSYEFKQAADDEIFSEKFPVNVTSLMNEDQLWGCFYLFPEMYEDSFSPTVKIRTPEELEDAPEGGILTRDLIATCLSYPARSPITGGYVYIKLNLASRQLQDISVLQKYRFLQYLDLSSNFLTDLHVLSDLPYLQYLSVAFNRLCNVLDYETPQWLLTEVHYRYNSVKKIRDLTPFWSIAVLDLSHNNIKTINGLHNLRFLRRLDLSFNHIQRLENLNHLRLNWLDVSYNNISSFECGPQVGLRTLLHLEHLDVNENQLTSLKIFSGCSRLRELHSRNNRLSTVLELAVHMRKLRHLNILDLRENPICSDSTYRAVVLNTLPSLLELDDETLDPEEQMIYKMQMTPDIMAHASRRLLRLLYVEQLSRARVSQFLPPADTTEVPIIVIVGPEASEKGTLCRRLAAECSSHVKQAILHTTATHHNPSHYHRVTHNKMDAMMIAGELLTYNEMNGESYALSREEAFVSDGRVSIACMDQFSALMLRLRCRRPYLILASCGDTRGFNRRQEERRRARTAEAATMLPVERSTLQVLVSGRIEVAGILHEIIMSLPDDNEQGEFEMASECSLSIDATFFKELRKVTAHRAAPLEEPLEEDDSQQDTSLYSLYKQSQGTYENASDANGHQSTERSTASRKPQHESKNHELEMNNMASKLTKNIENEAGARESGQSAAQTSVLQQGRGTTERPRKLSSMLSRHKSVDFSRYTSSTWKGMSVVPESAKSSKSVTFIPRENLSSVPGQQTQENVGQLTGLFLENKEGFIKGSQEVMGKSISTKLPPWLNENKVRSASGASLDDLDLWFNFMHETGLLQVDDGLCMSSETSQEEELKKEKLEDPNSILRHMCRGYPKVFKDVGSSITDDCESVNRKCPGIYWDTLNMDDSEGAFIKLKRVVKDIVNSQSKLLPMFDIDFKNSDSRVVQARLERFQKEICPKRLFY